MLVIYGFVVYQQWRKVVSLPQALPQTHTQIHNPHASALPPMRSPAVCAGNPFDPLVRVLSILFFFAPLTPVDICKTAVT